ncbi:MAG TPA: hypothetical protein V6D12_03505 [Candidatus Obscuribacterales bacterium]
MPAPLKIFDKLKIFRGAFIPCWLLSVSFIVIKSETKPQALLLAGLSPLKLGGLVASFLASLYSHPEFTYAATAEIRKRVGWVQTKLERIEKKLGTTPHR